MKQYDSIYYVLQFLSKQFMNQGQCSLRGIEQQATR